MRYFDKQCDKILNESTDLVDVAMGVGGVIGVSALVIGTLFSPHLFRKYKQTKDCKTKISMLQSKLSSDISNSDKQVIEKELEAVKKKCHMIENRKTTEHESFDEQCTSEVFSNLENNIRKFKENGNTVRALQMEKYLKELKIKCKNRRN